MTLTQWQIIGFVGQGVFTARFLVQWIASEKKRDSVVPIAFWWLSILGGSQLLVYAIHRQDPVFIVGQSLGMVIYARNLMLVSRKKRRVLKLAVRKGGHEENDASLPSSLKSPRECPHHSARSLAISANHRE